MHQNMCDIFVLLLLSILLHLVDGQSTKTIYQRIQEEEDFAGYASLIKSDSRSRIALKQEELTVFVPENSAFDNSNGNSYKSDVGFYHISSKSFTLDDLRKVNQVKSLHPLYPPLWITKIDDDLYVNNAKILLNSSDYVARTGNSPTGNKQVLHTIDQVLDPKFSSQQKNYTAYKFLSSQQKQTVPKQYQAFYFLHKIRTQHAFDVFKMNGSHTFFIPVDHGIDNHHMRTINKDTILGHVVPNYVLFTRPTTKDFNFETRANDNHVYTVLSMHENRGKVFVKSFNVFGDETNKKGEYFADIIQGNIPVENGVVHLISNPLGVYRRSLELFPYRTVLEKISNDPTLEYFYSLGETLGVHNIFKTHNNVSFTYFVPRDTSWRILKKNGLELIGSEVDLMTRHMVLSETPYSMEKLIALSENDDDLVLNSAAGPLRISVVKIDGDFYVKWNNNYVKVCRPDFECSDGVVHVLDHPLGRFRKPLLQKHTVSYLNVT